MNGAGSVRPHEGGPCRIRRGPPSFTLVEVVLAIGIISFCLIMLVPLIAVGMNTDRMVRQQIIGLSLCRQIESDLRATAPSTNASPLYGIPIPGVGATVTATLYDSYATSATNFGLARQNSSQYLFTIILTGPVAASPNDPVNAQIQASWPAQITPVPQSNPTNVIGSVNLDVAIDRFGS